MAFNFKFSPKQREQLLAEVEQAKAKGRRTIGGRLKERK